MPHGRAYRYIVKALRETAGQSLVETALSLSMLVFLVLGGTDMARAYSVQVGVLNAARAAAEARVTGAAATDAIAATYAIDELDRIPGVDASSATATCTPSTVSSVNLTTCRVQYTFRTIVPWPLVPNTLALDRSAVFRRYP